MAISHAFTNPVPDGTITSIVRPSDWNSAHNQYYTLSGNTLGASTVSGTNVVFQGSGNVSLSGTGQTIVLYATGGGGGGAALSAGTQSVSSGTVSFANSNGVSFGMSGSNQITASYTVPTSYVSNINGVSGAVSIVTGSSLSSVLAGSTLVIGLASNITTALQSANANYLTTQSVQTQASGNIARTGFSSTTTTGTAIVGTLDTNGLNLAVPAYLTSAAAGAANFVLTGATSGNTTASGSTINLSGVNVTLSGTNNSQIVISAPATSALTQGNNVSISNTGVTIGISAQAVAAAAGSQTANSGTVNFANSNGITFGMSGSNQITASHNGITSQTVQTQASGNIARTGFSSTTTTGTAIVGTLDTNGLNLGVPAYLTAAVGGGGVAIGASTQTATSGTVIFSNANGITFGLNNGTLTASAAAAPTAYVSSVNGSSGAISLNVGSSLSSSVNGSSITFGLASNITTALQSANANYLTTQSVQTQASGNIARTGFTSTTTTGTAIVGTLNTNGLNLGIPAYVTNAVGGGGVAINAGSQTATSGTVSFVNSNGITFGMSGSNQITASYTSIVDYIQSFNGNTGNVSLTVGNGLSLSNNPGFPEYTINLATNITTSLQNFSLGLSNLGNTAGNTGVTGTRIVFVGTNNISLSQATNTAGATITIDQAGGGAMYANLSGNVSGNTTASGNTLNFSGINVTLSGTNNSQIAISAPATSSLVGAAGISISSAGSTISVFNAYISSFENTPFQAVQTMSLNMASVSHAAIFNIPEPLSISYLRIPVLMTTNSTTIATTGTSATGGAAIYSTFNAVVYSIGTGGNSLSLQSVASGSAGFTFSNSISIATNGTQYSLSQGYSAQALGGGTTLTTQTSASTTNYAFSTNSFTAFTSARFLDIPFARSLVGGPYWIVFGGSTSSAATTGVAALSAMTNCNVRYSNHYGVSQTNLAFGVMGSSNLTSGGYFGAGSFSTAGGGTTNSINLSQISSSASHVRLYFQMLRFA